MQDDDSLVSQDSKENELKKLEGGEVSDSIDDKDNSLSHLAQEGGKADEGDDKDLTLKKSLTQAAGPADNQLLLPSL